MLKTKLAKELGKRGTGKYAYMTCPQCGNKRWVELRKGKPRREHCQPCAMRLRNYDKKGHLHQAWKGGRHKEMGYIVVYLYSDDPLYPMQKGGGYVKEHRLVMARYLGRCLKPWEIVHHKNGVKTDNRLGNLQLVSWDEHEQITQLECQVKKLRNRAILLEAENIVLRQQVRVE